MVVAKLSPRISQTGFDEMSEHGKMSNETSSTNGYRHKQVIEKRGWHQNLFGTLVT